MSFTTSLPILVIGTAASLAMGALPTADPASPSPSASGSASAVVLDAKAIYMEHCARCHGETGDGKGVTDLDRPARSFLDGGYSYGNTPAAVKRSVVHGIPGTPMPAFGETLGEDDIAAVAQYVIDLGPPGTVVEPGASVLTVGDLPMVVHGMMPALEEGGRREPRSLVVGFPNGTTFQYAMRNAGLRAVRQGEFLDRRDWGGRGGAPLQPLGTITWRANGALKTQSEFVDAETGAALTKVITKTRVMKDEVHIHFKLEDADGKHAGGGQEILSFLEVEGVPVATRALVGTGTTRKVKTRKIEGQPESAFVQDFDVEVSSFAAIEDPVVLMTYKPAEGVFAVTPSDLPGVRIYVHAAEWSQALSQAVAASLSQEG